MSKFYTPSAPGAATFQEPLGLKDLPFGRGPHKVVDTDNLRDPDDSDPPLDVTSGARMVGYYGLRSGIPFDNVQDAIDFLAGGGFAIVPAQANTSGGIPLNTGVPRFVAVTTPGSGAVLGDLLYDNGLADGLPMTIIPAKDGRTISVTDYLFGGVLTLQPDQLYVWDVALVAWVIPDTSALEATIIVTGASNGSAPFLPVNTGTRGFRAVYTTGFPISATYGEILYDNGSGVGPQIVLSAREGRLISVSDDINFPAAIPPMVFPQDTVWQWNADVPARWLQVGRGGFLAPNELYVDTDRIATGNVGREVGTLADALALAETLYAPGIDVIIRFREQAHNASGVTFPATRNWSLYAEASAGGPGIDTTTVGNITLSGPATSWGNPAALLPVTGTVRVLQFKGINLLGGLYQNAGWKLTFDEVVFAGLAVTIDQNAGVGIVPEFSCTNCSDDATFFTIDHTIKIVTTNLTGGPTHTNLFFERCAFSLENIAPKGNVPPIQPLKSSLAFAGCIFGCSIDADSAPIFAGGFSFVFNQSTINLSVLGGGTGQVFTTPTIVAWSHTEIDVALTGGSNWRLFASAFTPAIQRGLPRAGRLETPPFPPQWVGMEIQDETLKAPDTGRAGSVTPRVLDGEGYAMAGGSHVYATHLTVGITGPEPMEILLPSGTGPTYPELAIQDQRVVAFRVRVEARNNGGTFDAAGFDFEGYATRDDAGAGLVFQGTAPNKVTAFETTVGAVDANLSVVSGTGISIDVTSTIAKGFQWRAVIQWVVR